MSLNVATWEWVKGRAVAIHSSLVHRTKSNKSVVDALTERPRAFVVDE